MPSVTLARNAMATRFEMVLHGANENRLRAAGEEALAEIERIEAQLSLFRPTSEIARINSYAATQPVRVTPSVFQLLRDARKLSDETNGAFDITIGPLMRSWGFQGGAGAMQKPEEIESVRQKIGMHHVHLDEKSLTVSLDTEGVTLDLGAIGKGYAIDQAVQILRESGVENALLHGGTSTVFGMGKPPDEASWKVAIDRPDGMEALATMELCESALSVSAVHGKSFQAGGKTFGHVLDPRTGWPAAEAALAAVGLPSAMETDAVSTALLVVGVDGFDAIAGLRPNMAALVLVQKEGEWDVKSRQISVRSLGKR